MSDIDEKIVVYLARISARVDEIGAQVTALRAQNSGIVHRLDAVSKDASEASAQAQYAHIVASTLYNLAVDFDDAERRLAHEKH